MPTLLRIPVDFNSMMMEPYQRVIVHPSVVAHYQYQLQPHLRVVLYDEEMAVEAIMDYENYSQIWFGVPDWSTCINI